MAKKAEKPPEKSGDEAPVNKKPSMKLALVVAVLMSLVGVGAGFGLSYYTFISASKTETEAAANHGAEGESDPKHDEASGNVEGEKADKHGEDVAEKSDHGDKAEEPKDGESGGSDGEHGEEKAASGHGEQSGGESKEAAPADGHGESGDAAATGPSSTTLDPVVTNISKPSDVWVRLEAVLRTSKPLPSEVSDQIHQDFMSFFHTLRLDDLEGGSSYNDLKAELLARANNRADGQIETIFFKTFLFE